MKLRAAVLLTVGLMSVFSGRVFAAINPVCIKTLPGCFGDMVVSGNYLYAANLSTAPDSGLRIFDVSNPANPVDVGYNDGQGSAAAVAVSGNHAFVVYSGSVGILDISNPSNPIFIGRVAGSWGAVTVSGRYAYLTRGFALNIFDISSPANPVSVGTINGSFYAPAVLGDYAYLLGAGFFVYDVSNPSAPVGVGPISSYWGDDVAASGDYAYIVAATNNFWIFNISNRTNPVNVFSGGWQPLALKVRVSGNYAFLMCQELAEEVRIYDVSDPTNATSASTITLDYGTVSLAVSANYAYVCNGTQLSIYSLGIPFPTLSISGNSVSTLVLSWPTPTGAFAVQETPDLRTANWTTLTNTPMVVGPLNRVSVPKPPGTMFYRLVAQ